MTDGQVIILQSAAEPANKRKRGDMGTHVSALSYRRGELAEVLGLVLDLWLFWGRDRGENRFCVISNHR
jgi:hypothetical protein